MPIIGPVKLLELYTESDMGKRCTSYVIGMDFGTDSVRSLLLDASSGMTLAVSEFKYPRWATKTYCDPASNQFRQHPLDYMEGLEFTLQEITKGLDQEAKDCIRAISICTTGSTPVAVDAQGTPLALDPHFKDNPNAMFFLWKDHCAKEEAARINRYNDGSTIDYLKFVGGAYSSEWYWAKLMYVLDNDTEVRDALYGWVEHSDWMPFLLTGGNQLDHMVRNRCAAGHKALWSEQFGGLPLEDFILKVFPTIRECGDFSYGDTYTSDRSVGYLSADWAERLGLHENIKVGVGGLDAHFAAIGAAIRPNQLCKVMGTSTCDMAVVPAHEGDIYVDGICGQVNGSIIPGMVGMEAGQSAFGDIFDWFAELLLWPTRTLGSESLLQIDRNLLLKTLGEQAEALAEIPMEEIATDWFNGRRSPFASNGLKATLTGFGLGTSAPKLYHVLMESACFGSKRIMEQYEDEGVTLNKIVVMGGVAKKSPYLVQLLANILDRPVHVCREEQTAALGSGMFAATVAGLYTSVEDAISSMGQDIDRVYHPQPGQVERYQKRYERYKALCEQTDATVTSPGHAPELN